MERRQKIARHYCEGKSQADIAELMGISHVNVSKDLAAIRELWLSLMLADFDQRKSEELAKISHLETTAWEEFEKSRSPLKIRKRGLEKAPRMVEKPTKDTPGRFEMLPVKVTEDCEYRKREGNPKWLEIVDRCIEKRLKLLGIIDQPAQSNVYINFDALYKEAKPDQDVIENEIAQVGLSEAKEEERLPIGLKEISELGGSTHDTATPG